MRRHPWMVIAVAEHCCRCDLRWSGRDLCQRQTQNQRHRDRLHGRDWSRHVCIDILRVWAPRRQAVSLKPEGAGRSRLAPRRFQIRKCAAVRMIPVTIANMQENSTTSMASLVMIRSPRNTPPSLARLRPLLKVGGKVTTGCLNSSSGIPVGLVCISPSLQAGALSNAQCEQRYEADAREQHRECQGIIFKPIPIRMHDATHCYAIF
jgi:hypothetical protein